jgi:DNA-binding NarL/FixJ family response regulator
VSEPIRVLVVDDHFVVRKGVCALLADAGEIAVVGEAADGRQAVAEAQLLRPRVILMDLKLPELDGVAATRSILAADPGAGIVIMTGTEVESEILAAIEAGALGYLAKTSPREEFLEAIRRVAQGEAWLPLGLTRKLLTHLKPRPAAETMEALTQQEGEVLRRLARGWSNRRIAGDLGVADSTVRTHVSRILGKLGVSNRVEAALHALRAGLAPVESPGEAP